jgi:ABC-2 type transport system ATP-binding protein
MTPILEIKNLNKKYGQYTALNNIDLTVPKGSIFGLLGPNGAGKTSLIRIINQIIMPDSGTITFDGQRLAPTHIHQVGYMPEERGLYQNMKVGAQCLYLAQLKGMSKSNAEQQLKYWFDKLDLNGWWNKKIIELSKGMAQKIQFVVCVLHQPKLLIFDEPFSGFDPVNANIIKDEILELRKKGTTIIFSTHRMESVEAMCDDIALIHKSNKLIEGKLSDVKLEHRTNTFELGVQTTDIEGFIYALSKEYTFTQGDFKTIQNSLKLEVNLNKKSSNDLLLLATQKGLVTHFSEKIPSIDDIFIKTVSEN